jgi:O-antigen biosynthesis protein
MRLTAPLRATVRRSVKTARWLTNGQLLAQLRARWDLIKARQAILRSGLFDEAWYRERYPEVVELGLDPILQFLVDGATHGRNPSPNFSVKRYRWHNPDVAVLGINPLLHYIRQGKAEGREALPVPGSSATGRGPSERRSNDPEYDDWIESYDTIAPEAIVEIRAKIEAMAVKPLISVVMPVYNPPPAFLARAIESVREQLYPHWELCIADDASTDAAVTEVLTRFAALDDRIKLCRRPVNGHISAASNTALELATGEYVALLDHDDELAEHALFCVAREIGQHPHTDMLFSDEDKIDEAGYRSTPYFKSGWNPDLMLSQNAFCHLGVFRRSLLEQIGGFRTGFEGAQDYDLVLRMSERTSPARIRHIPRILYHWRMIRGSTATAVSEKPYAWLAGQRAIEEHLQRIGRAAKVLPAAGGSFYRIADELPTEPRVSVIIPTRDGLNLLKGCITSLLEVSTYRNIEIIIVDNGSTDPKTLAYLAGLAKAGTAKVMRDDGAFNFSRLNNAAAEIATGDYLCLLNNDTVVISPGWLHEMVSLAARPGVGAVGPMLYYANDTIQHAGLITGIGGVAGHVHRALPRGDLGYFGRAAVTQTLSIVTGACLLTSRAIYRELGGLNARDLTVAFNDVDYCLRLGAAGYRVVWTPFAELYHLESISRGSDLDGAKRKRFQQETDYMMEQWGEILAADPYYNPNLDLTSTTPGIALQPRLSAIWM